MNVIVVYLILTNIRSFEHGRHIICT